MKLIPTLKKAVWRNLARKMNLTYGLDCGLTLSIVNYSDWLTYNEVFVEREYEALLKPLSAILNHTQGTTIFDLGANVGFFSAFVSDRLQKSGTRSQVKFILVEATPFLAEELSARMPKTCGSFNFEVKQGLAGKRSGAVRFEIEYKDNGSHVSGVGNASQTVRGVQCEYLDLRTLVEPSDHIACIKVDIEGSEFDLIREYRDLLARAHTLVIEFHHESGDPAAALKELAALGFRVDAVCKVTPQTSTYLLVGKHASLLP